MTTHSSAYYRDLLHRISLMESAGDLPQWFRRAWSAGHITTDMDYASGSLGSIPLARFHFDLPLQPLLPNQLQIEFFVTSDYEIKFGPNDGLGYPTIKFASEQNMAQARQANLSEKLPLFLKDIFGVDPGNLLGWDKYSLWMILIAEMDFYTVIKHQLASVSQQLFNLADDK